VFTVSLLPGPKPEASIKVCSPNPRCVLLTRIVCTCWRSTGCSSLVKPGPVVVSCLAGRL